MSFRQRGSILYVSMADVTEPTGPGVNEREFLLALYDRAGRRMHALVPRPRRTCSELDLSRTTFYRNPRRWDLAGFVQQQLGLQRQIRSLLAARQYDLMVARLSIIPLAFYWFREGSVPCAIKTLEDVQGFVRNRGVKGCVAKLLGPLNERLFRGIVRRAVAVDCCTDTLMRQHMQRFQLSPPRLTVIENATNVKRFCPRNAADAKAASGILSFDPVLGFVGGSPVERGGLQILELTRRLQHDYPRIGAVIVGDDKGGVMKRQAASLGIARRVNLPGVVPYEVIPTYVNCFDIGFALDRPERWRLTGNSYQKVRQYLACGKPVVTCLDLTADLAQRRLVESVAAHDLELLEKSVRRLLGRSCSEVAQFAARARQFVCAQLSTEAALERRLGFWEKRLSEQAGGAGVGKAAA